MAKLRFAIALLIGATTATAYGKPVESWECRSISVAHWNNILVEATVDPGREMGSISVAGVVHRAQFAVKGFNRRWDFVLNERDAFDYAFVVKPDGDGSYYDFTNDEPGSIVQPSMMMVCRQKL